MKLRCDDYLQVYVWVDDCNPDVVLSPHFDYEEDAVAWKRDLVNELGTSQDPSL